MNPIEWVNARSIREAVAELGPRSIIKAGGVDLMDLLKERLVAPSRLVNLRTVPGLDKISESAETGLSVGPMVTLARLAAEPLVHKRWRALADAAGQAATPQLRNMATVGGNLLQRPQCWYFRSLLSVCRKKGGVKCYAHEGENAYHAVFGNSLCAMVHPSATATALIALGATLEVTGPSGARRVMLEAFLQAPEVDVRRENGLRDDEIITQIRVPALAPGASSAYAKQGEKESFDWPLAEAGVVLQIASGACVRASVVLGAAAPVPWRATLAEAALVGRPITLEVATNAAIAAMRSATPLTQNAYKLPIFEAIVRRAILAASATEAAP